jgi:ferric-dicitrate binding protein FerR (iron transport regulator)
VKGRASSEVVLAAGQEALVDGSGVVSTGPSQGTQTWASGELRFRDVTMEELAETLDRWYGIQLKVDDALRGRRVTTGLNAGTVRGVVQELGLTMDVDVEWVGDTAIVRPRGGNR